MGIHQASGQGVEDVLRSGGTARGEVDAETRRRESHGVEGGEMSLTPEIINNILDGNNLTTGMPHDEFTLEEFRALLATIPKFENIWQALAKQNGFDLDAGDGLAIGAPMFRELERQFPELLPLPMHPRVKV